MESRIKQESRILRSCHVVTSSDECPLRGRRKKKGKSGRRETKTRVGRERGGVILRTTCVSEKEEHFHIAWCEMIGPRTSVTEKHYTWSNVDRIAIRRTVRIASWYSIARRHTNCKCRIMPVTVTGSLPVMQCGPQVNL